MVLPKQAMQCLVSQIVKTCYLRVTQVLSEDPFSYFSFHLSDFKIS